ncbi:MAG: aminopeptidase P N-terminal domain-containing protein [Verrucomicrobiota bacterium]
MRYSPPSPSFYTQNRAHLAANLPGNALAVLHSNDVMPTSADGTMTFHQNRDLLYLCGIDQEETILILFPDAPDPQDREILFIRETSDLIAIWEGQKFTQKQAAQISGIENIQWTNTFEHSLRRLMKKTNTVFLNYNEHARATRQVQSRDDRFRDQCQTNWPNHHYHRIAPLISALRAIKAPEETDLLQIACDITEAGFSRVLKFIKPGVTEYQVEAEFLHEFLHRRSRGFAYTPIVASGKNNCVLHYLDNNETLQDGDLLLMDVAAEYAGYNADMTRTVPVNGHFSKRQRAVYNAVLRVLNTAANDLLRPGIAIKDYQKQVARLVERELVDLTLLSAEQVNADNANPDTPEETKAYRQYFMHGTSHLLGLDVHDVGPADLIVREGMVFTVEPGLYLREEGFGIRLENNYLVGKDSNTNLMADIPIDPDEIEAMMAK